MQRLLSSIDDVAEPNLSKQCITQAFQLNGEKNYQI